MVAKTAALAADHWFRTSGGGDGAALAACLTATMDAEDGAPGAVERLTDALETARSNGDVEVEVLPLDALAAVRAGEGAISEATDLLDCADALAPDAGHGLVDRDRLDVVRARDLLEAGDGVADLTPGSVVPGALRCQGGVRGRAQSGRMTPTALLALSRRHATCAWCRSEHPTIVALLVHVDEEHFEASAATTGGRLARAA